MSFNKSITFALCLAVTGCAQNPQNASADHSPRWWQFGSSASSENKDVEQAINEKVAKADAASDTASHWWWPFGETASNDNKAKPVEAPAPAKVAKAETAQRWWWPFGSTEEPKEQPKVVPMPDPKITQAWLDSYEPRLREAIKDSRFELERRENLLVITAPVDSSFNPDRPAMLLPVSLGPITRVAKLVEGDPKTAVLVLGHADTSGAAAANQVVSQDRAKSIAAIFRLSGLERNRLTLRGMGSVMPRAANDSPQGRSLNRRVEILLTPQDTMVALLAKYNQPTPPAAELVAVQNVQPLPAKVAEKAPAKKAVAKKAAAKPAAKKATPAKTAAKKPATTAAKKPAADAAKAN